MWQRVRGPSARPVRAPMRRHRVLPRAMPVAPQPGSWRGETAGYAMPRYEPARRSWRVGSRWVPSNRGQNPRLTTARSSACYEPAARARLRPERRGLQPIVDDSPNWGPVREPGVGCGPRLATAITRRRSRADRTGPCANACAVSSVRQCGYQTPPAHRGDGRRPCWASA